MILNRNQINLLWTGGWDSTFALLYSVIIKKISVQPYYLIDHKRQSTGHELRAMADIITEFRIKYPYLGHLIKPVIYKSDLDLLENNEINEWYRLYVKYHNLGSQYKFIALWAEELQTALMYSFDKPINGYTHRQQLLTTQFTVNGQFARLKKNPEPFYLRLFQKAEFFYGITKPEMGSFAQKHDFYDLMLKTWFCHFPKLDYPCGICDPCATVIWNNLKFRMPKISLLRYHLNQIFNKSFHQ